MKRMLSLLLLLLLIAASAGCELAVGTFSDNYAGATPELSEPAVVAVLATPAPTPEPRVLSYSLGDALFRRDGVTATVNSVTYSENQSITVTVGLENRTAQPLLFAGRVPGAVNGWAFVFTTEGLDEGDFIAVAPEGTEVVTLSTALHAGAVAQMALTDVQSITLSFYGTLGEKAFAPVSNVVENPACEAGYVQRYADETLLLGQSARARYYYLGLDPVTAMLYVSAESLGAPFDMTVIPCVNGYAVGTGGTDACFTTGGTHALLSVPLLDTVRAYAINSMETLTLSVLLSQNGKSAGADVVNVPVGEEAIAALSGASIESVVTASESAPAYTGAGRTFFDAGDIQLYYESSQVEPDDYYGRITRYRLLCVNNTADTLYPAATVVKLAGAKMDGAFYGTIPAYSVTNIDFVVCANVNKGAEVALELELLDGSAKQKLVAREPVTFVS